MATKNFVEYLLLVVKLQPIPLGLVYSFLELFLLLVEELLEHCDLLDVLFSAWPLLNKLLHLFHTSLVELNLVFSLYFDV